MRRTVRVVAAAALMVGLASPAGATRHSDDQGHYRHHERYRGDYYNYPDFRGSDPYSEDGPYDGYYDCRPHETPNHHPETWCDHYYGYRS